MPIELPLLILAAAVVAAALILARRAVGGGDPVTAGGRGLDRLVERLEVTGERMTRVAAVMDERRSLEERTLEAVGRLERTLTGSFSRGRMGENLLAAALDEFPPEMVVRDFKVKGKVCEFALRASDGTLLPIDSKWPASDLAAGIEVIEDPGTRERSRRQVEREVMARIEEVAHYVDPALTLPMAVMAVPDGVYACCRKAHAAAKDRRVVIVSYSGAVPYLLGIWLLHRTYSRDVDSHRLLRQIEEVATSLGEIESRLEGQLARSLTMAANAVANIRVLVAGARTAIDALERHRDSVEAEEVAG